MLKKRTNENKFQGGALASIKGEGVKRKKPKKSSWQRKPQDTCVKDGSKKDGPKTGTGQGSQGEPGRAIRGSSGQEWCKGPAIPKR